MSSSKTAPTLLVLAAGMGSRFGGLKQIEGVGPNGEVILDYSIYDAIKAGFEKAVFVIRRDIEKVFRESVGSRFENRLEVEYVFQELDCLPEGYTVPDGREKPWGTGHAVLVARDAVQSPFAIINADDYYGAHSFQILGDYLSDTDNTCEINGVEHGAMVGFRLDQTLSSHGGVSRGVCTINADKTLQDIKEHKRIEAVDDHAVGYDMNGQEKHLTFDTQVSMNMWGLSPYVFGYFEKDFSQFLESDRDLTTDEFHLPAVINGLLSTGRGRFKVLQTPDTWIGVTYREDAPSVRERFAEFVREGQYPSPLWK